MTINIVIHNIDERCFYIIINEQFRSNIFYFMLYVNPIIERAARKKRKFLFLKLKSDMEYRSIAEKKERSHCCSFYGCSFLFATITHPAWLMDEIITFNVDMLWCEVFDS